jgi:hypothetical protein
MENKWLLYEKTLQNIHNNQKIFMNMLIYYYKLVIIDKHNNKEYIKENYPKQNIGHLDLFNEYIVETKNIGIFTIFNNIPDVIHPLEKDYYYNYGMYISFIDPKYFKKSEKDDIVILDKNIWKYSEYKYSYYQDVAPYNKYKKYIYLNIKYFDIEKYKNYLIIIVNDNKEVYIFDNNIIKKKNKNKWKIINIKDINISKLIYACVLRKISQKDLFNVFNVNKLIKKDTLLYTWNVKPLDKSLECIYFFSFNKDDYLNDPYKILYKSGDELYLHTTKVKKDYTTINLTCDILSNNKLNETKEIEPIETLLNINKSKNFDFKKYSNYIYNGNINYMYYNDNHNLIWNNNMGKRLLFEIMLKSSNFVNLSYKRFLAEYDINHFVFACGYYNKLNLFHNYELFHNIDDDELEFIKVEKEKMDKDY